MATLTGGLIMAHAIYRVTLTDEEIGILEDIIHRGKHSAQKRKRAQAMLLAHQGVTDKSNSATSGMRVRSIEDMRKNFVEHGFERTINGMPKEARPETLSGEDKARLIALACEVKPDGHSHWSLRVIREKFLALENITVDDVSHETIRKVLKKAIPSRGKGENGASRRKPTRNS